MIRATDLVQKWWNETTSTLHRLIGQYWLPCTFLIPINLSLPFCCQHFFLSGKPNALVDSKKYVQGTPDLLPLSFLTVQSTAVTLLFLMNPVQDKSHLLQSNQLEEIPHSINGMIMIIFYNNLGYLVFALSGKENKKNVFDLDWNDLSGRMKKMLWSRGQNTRLSYHNTHCIGVNRFVPPWHSFSSYKYNLSYQINEIHWTSQTRFVFWQKQQPNGSLWSVVSGSLFNLEQVLVWWLFRRNDYYGYSGTIIITFLLLVNMINLPFFQFRKGIKSQMLTWKVRHWYLKRVPDRPKLLSRDLDFSTRQHNWMIWISRKRSM